jgi:peptidyl-prolyl cis-trans isomerase SurA
LAPSGAAAAGVEVIDRIVAIVNDDVITLSELNRLYEPQLRDVRAMGYPLAQERKLLFKLREQTLQRLIDDKLTEQEIKRQDLSVDEEQIDQAVERLKAGKYVTDEQLREALAKDGLTMEQMREQIRQQILRRKLLASEVSSKVVVTREEAREYYEAKPERYAGENKFHLHNFMIRVAPGGGDAARQAALNQMEAVRAQLAQGQPAEAVGQAFAGVDPPVFSSELGKFKAEELSPEIREKLQGKRAGQSTEILPTDFGYQLLFVLDVEKTPARSFEEVAAEIQDQIYQERFDAKFRAWLKDLRQQSHIKIIQ